MSFGKKQDSHSCWILSRYFVMTLLVSSEMSSSFYIFVFTDLASHTTNKDVWLMKTWQDGTWVDGIDFLATSFPPSRIRCARHWFVSELIDWLYVENWAGKLMMRNIENGKVVITFTRWRQHCVAIESMKNERKTFRKFNLAWKKKNENKRKRKRSD